MDCIDKIFFVRILKKNLNLAIFLKKMTILSKLPN